MPSLQARRLHGWIQIVLLVAICGCAASQTAQRSPSTVESNTEIASSDETIEESHETSLELTAYDDADSEQSDKPVTNAIGSDNGEPNALESNDIELNDSGINTPEPSGSRRPGEGQGLNSYDIETAPDGELNAQSISVVDVAESIHSTFPLLVAAYQENQITAGKQIAAWGAFDTKLKAASENGPTGFYQTYRHSTGVSQPLYSGGEVFGGYRIGRGDFQPWYKERQTDDGGEFKAGVSLPLIRNREIDARRAELWRATYDRQRALPEIRAQLIMFVRDGSLAYWNWVAAVRQYRIGYGALQLADQRNVQIEEKVKAGDTDPPVLQDNLRLMAKREGKLIDLKRKVQQSGVKLSLFLRTPDGVPFVPAVSKQIDFPQPSFVERAQFENDVAAALSQRPELVALDAMARRANVDLAEARNDMLPILDAQVSGSQDVGEPTSKKRDKSQFELEAGVYMELPIQRRKGRGKAIAAQGKLVQISAKRRFTEDKIRAEVQAVHAALLAAYDRLDRARESKRLAEYIADVEREKFRAGASELLAVALREQYAIEAQEAEVDALLEYFAAKADYDAVLARVWPQ